MKEDISTATSNESSTSLTKIFQELAKLEKDFRYQETLYKIKAEELDKVTATNKILKEHLETAYSEIETLRNKLQILEKKFHEFEIVCTQEKEFCAQVVQKLTNKITHMSDEQKSTLEQQEARRKHIRSELQEEHNLFINELQRRHGETLLELEQELEQKSNQVRELVIHTCFSKPDKFISFQIRQQQTKLDFTMEDNLLLQDKLRKMQQEYLPVEAYKTQLKNLSTTNEKLKTQCTQIKKEYRALLNDNTHLKQHNEQLNDVLSDYNKNKMQLEAEKKDLQLVTSKVQLKLNEMKEESDLLQNQCNILREENSKLSKELELYKGDYCNIDMHRNITEQNKILQELVKEMRKERMKCTGDQLQTNLDETEERIKRLEELIYELKKVLVYRLNLS